MATLTAQTTAHTGVVITFAAAAGGGDKVAWDKNTFLLVDNADAAPHTVTIASEATASPGLVQTDVAVAIAAGAQKLIGPFSSAAFRDSDGFVNWTYDAVTDVTVAAVKIPAV